MHPHFCSIENPLAFPSVNVASQVDKRYIVLLIKQTIYRFEVGPGMSFSKKVLQCNCSLVYAQTSILIRFATGDP